MLMRDDGAVSEEKIKDLLKYRFNIVPVYLNAQNIQEGVPQLISKELALKHVLIPFKQSSFRLLVAMADPFDAEAIEEIQKVTGLTVLPRKAEADEIINMIEHFYPDEGTEGPEDAETVARPAVEAEESPDDKEPETVREEIKVVKQREKVAVEDEAENEDLEAIRESETLREIEAIRALEEKELLKKLAEAEKSEQAKETEEDSDKKKEIKELKKTEEIAKEKTIKAVEEIEEEVEEVEEKTEEIEEEIEEKIENRNEREKTAPVRDLEESPKESRQPVRRLSFRDRILGIGRTEQKENISDKNVEKINAAPEDETKKVAGREIKDETEKASRLEIKDEAEIASRPEANDEVEIAAEPKAEVVLEAAPAREITEEADEEEEPAEETAAAEEALHTVPEKQTEQFSCLHDDSEMPPEEIKAEVSRNLPEERYEKKDNKGLSAQEDMENEAKIHREEETERDLEKEATEDIKSPARNEEPREIEKKKNEPERVGSILVGSEVRHDEVQSEMKLQKKAKQKIGEFVVERPVLEEDELVRTLSRQTGVPAVKLNEIVINPDIPTLIKETLARKHMLIPIRIEKGQLHVAMVDPLNVYAIDDVKIATGFSVVPFVAGKKEIIKAIDQYYGQLTTEEAVEDLMKEMDTEVEDVQEKEVLSTINNAPLVRLVNSLLRQAVTMKASDVHIEPFENIVRVRFRIDGDLQEIMNLDVNTHPAVVARIKIMGKMNIAERRVPQDGRVEIRVEDRAIDLRLSTLPTAYGEKVVIRILDREGATFNRKKLGFSREALERLDTVIHNSCGIILVTGPTGSGKSSTLYTILTELNKINLNIITIEDPIEYRMAGVNQVQVNHKAGLDFASGLRSILRQDPDIIMVGEIRDTETVQIAVRAAITGHLVLSTIHTNDTASTISRLVDMGVEPYLISSSLVGIIAQRLVKKICPECKTEYHPNDFEKIALGLPQDAVTYKGKGCLSCNNTGYSGRTAIAEIMDINYEIKKMINERRSIDEIKEHALKRGMISLQDSCRRLVLQGVTTIDEYFRSAYVVE